MAREQCLFDVNARNLVEDDGTELGHPRENLITWFTNEFGFTRNAAIALHDVQALKDAQALSELDNNDAVANVCMAVGKDLGTSVAELAATKLKLACFWIRHQYRTSRDIGGDPKTTCKD